MKSLRTAIDLSNGCGGHVTAEPWPGSVHRAHEGVQGKVARDENRWGAGCVPLCRYCLSAGATSGLFVGRSPETGHADRPRRQQTPHEDEPTPSFHFGRGSEGSG